MKILFVCKSQFGYHLDTWYHCKYLSLSDEVSTICFDYGKEKRFISNVNVSYVSRVGNSLTRMYRFIRVAANIIGANRFDVVFLKYFSGCTLLRILYPKVKFVFDIRTADVSGHYLKRSIKDALMKLESYFFPNISIISNSLRLQLGYSESTFILPLGAELNVLSRVRCDRLNLLYVGTLSGRDLEKTLFGIRLYLDENPTSQISYTIVGDGWSDERAKLEELADTLDISHVVQFCGFIHHNDMKELLTESNVGVSFVPMRAYFENQPVTKTYEYLLCGLPVIATATFENSRVINEGNGVLIKDNANDFAKALRDIQMKIQSNSLAVNPYDYEVYSWQAIVGRLRVYLSSIKR